MLTTLLAAVPAAAETGADPGFLRTERLVTGGSLSTSWRNLEYGTARTYDQIGSDGIAAEERYWRARKGPSE
mgnify:CR=1 FL=1